MRLSGKYYVCSSGETFDSVALSVYGEEKYAAELYGANPALCRRAVFVGGERLALPVVTMAERGERMTETAPWKE